jgi:hypothetical protein
VPDNERINAIAVLLQRAARQHRFVPYQKLHTLFLDEEPLTLRYRALEDAIALLGDCAELDYGCLMALDNGLPGDDFFNRFKRHRPHEFEAVMGYASTGRSLIKKRVIAEAERARVFIHAAQGWTLPFQRLSTNADTLSRRALDLCDGRHAD